ncbi:MULTISPECIES: acyl-CoA dehydratase activase-related protein [unclassified Fusibacter]|uniref:acyl-CoA dehydratase activase-related protein n=1 Tax=unclassified Fusibacter TaxID=2624464 RepID=UPI001010BF4B|nr:MULTISPECIES: acyl-CoA dehydratase activase-related protein [unclassified Fusibacter]NPE22598.1 2-hydroxyglutaryl-CoA dehydratase [Fusibacter sp. A1]RXV60698.1 2-hydroxyglutaryl-CoA dehydratase [Fusibacter sp. A1]
MKIGIDIGSTTIKLVALDFEDKVIYKNYIRHKSQVDETVIYLIKDYLSKGHTQDVTLSVTGSAGLGLSEALSIPFVQEVIAGTKVVLARNPETDVVIELGGEDQKIIFLGDSVEQRMNGACAGGTGAFIDQMAQLLNLNATELNELAKKHTKIYPIASRCGVFAKTDLQALLNQGIALEDLAASIFQAVVNQTIAGLAQGRVIAGNICFLGGPLTFLSELRERFIATLNLKNGVLPADSEFYVAIGAAMLIKPDWAFDVRSIIEKIESKGHRTGQNNRLNALFETEEERIAFNKRHSEDSLTYASLSDFTGDVVIGIDAGSTTTKLVVISPEGTLLYQKYIYNEGKVITLIKSALLEVYSMMGDRCRVISSGVTGYGESLIKKAFNIDLGEVETLAHYEAAKFFNKDVDFVLDIGGQDMKSFKIRNGVIESILLNEACSSGCGSFISTFANGLGYDVSSFAQRGLYGTSPVDLGTRCTIFMNSNVKQAQKEGASIEDLSAGLSMSVIKNALYKVIRLDQREKLGENIVVQGGTFYNDSVLRAFELETGTNVVRPKISGLMGAFGIALLALKASKRPSSIKSRIEIEALSFKSTTVHCNKCENNCLLSISTFNNGDKEVHGHRCERGIGITEVGDTFNMFDYKLNLIQTYRKRNGHRETIGIPLVLNMYENLPFWSTFFHTLGYGVVASEPSTKAVYEMGQYTIPSDTVCYPGKLIHGHMETLLKQKTDYIYYPCMTYNFKEKEHPKNHYNCPVVAYYPEVIANNVDSICRSTYITDYIGLHDKKSFVRQMSATLKKMNYSGSRREVEKAYQLGMKAYFEFKGKIIDRGSETLDHARQSGKKAIVLAGRPYHIDPEVNHGLSQLLSMMGVVTLTEDSISHLKNHKDPTVLNQWTYHTRLYDAAKFVSESEGINLSLVQLVSFGCGLDAITVDETKKILESSGKVYTQIKIDEMSNLGAIKIRLRSLLATMER